MSDKTTFSVLVPEVHHQEYLVGASSAEDAWNAVIDGEGEMLGKPEYEHILDGVMFEEWRVEQVETSECRTLVARCEDGTATFEVFTTSNEDGSVEYHADIAPNTIEMIVRVPLPDATSRRDAIVKALERAPRSA